MHSPTSTHTQSVYIYNHVWSCCWICQQVPLISSQSHSSTLWSFNLSSLLQDFIHSFLTSIIFISCPILFDSLFKGVSRKIDYKLFMDSDFWVSRLAAAKRQFFNHHNSHLNAHLGLFDSFYLLYFILIFWLWYMFVANAHVFHYDIHVIVERNRNLLVFFGCFRNADCWWRWWWWWGGGWNRISMPLLLWGIWFHSTLPSSWAWALHSDSWNSKFVSVIVFIFLICEFHFLNMFFFCDFVVESSVLCWF